MHALALSTMWSQLRHTSLAEFVLEAQSLGFAQVELSHVVTPAMLEALPADLYPAVRVLHHPCPNPGNVPELSDPDESCRTTAVAAATRTIQWAGRIGARAVVLHLGEVLLDRRWENALRARWLQGERDEEAYVALAAHMAGLRQAHSHAPLHAAHRSLAELVPIAEAQGVRLGVETAEWFFAFPSLDEARALLAAFPAPTVGLWVDTGHATILERLGFGSLRAWLELDPDRLLGLHLHDVHGLRDHLIPGKGTLDWAALAPLIPPHALLTCEWDWYYTGEELRAGVEWLWRVYASLGVSNEA